MNLLYISNISGKRMSYGFSGSAIEAAHSLGYRFYSVANRSNSTNEDICADEEKYGIKLLHVNLSRNPFSVKNVKAYYELCEIIRKYDIDCIHCNTPVGGVLGRLVGKKCKIRKVIYQAHGFHFYNGAPKLNWILYYPVEKWLAHYTDAIITINQEDYELAKNKFKLRNNGKIYYVPGVGIDLKQYQTDEKIRKIKRCELCLEEDEIAVISMGDLIKRKNYETAIRAIEKTKNKNLQYFICGCGPEGNNLKILAKQLGIEEQIHFLGFRSDIKELLQAADIFLFTTKQEGLPRSMMEAMASGLPCVASKVRGNVDLIEQKNGGFLCEVNDSDEYAKRIDILIQDTVLRQKMSQYNFINIKEYDVSVIGCELKKIYQEVIN